MSLFTQELKMIIRSDFITGNQIARVGIVENPEQYSSTNLLSASKASAVYALNTGVGAATATFTADAEIRQTVGLGSTAVGRVISRCSYWCS